MSDFPPPHCSRSTLCCSPVLALLLATAALPGCADDGETSPGAETGTNELDRADNTQPGACLWETDELLSYVRGRAPEIVDCGLFLGDQPLENECFTSGLEAGRAVQITINNCIDCMIHSTYLSTPTTGKFHLYREADYAGDDVRIVIVEKCSDFGAGEGSGANCLSPNIRYACSDPLPEPSDL